MLLNKNINIIKHIKIKGGNEEMKCPKCGSENVNVQMVSESQLKTKHHSILYWICIGWWLKPILWFCLTIPMLLGKMFGHKKQKIVTTHNSMAVCQNCGHSWKAN